MNLGEVGQLHFKNLPGSSLSELGLRAVTEYYSFVNSSRLEKIFVIGEEDIVGAAVISFEPHSLMKRFMLWYVVRGTWRFSIASSVKGAIRALVECIGSSANPAQLQALPEVVQIFVHERHRQQGIGKKLLSKIEVYLKSRRERAYFLRTENIASNGALMFYEKLGFMRVGLPSEEERFIYFIKQL